MFRTELKFAADCLIDWFNKNIKSKNLELDIRQKIDYERLHPVDWKNDKFCICNFPLKIDGKSINAKAKEMNYLELNIRNKHKVLRNVLSEEQLRKSQALKPLDAYYDAFERFLRFVVFLEDTINDSPDFDDIVNDNVRIFWRQSCADFSDYMEILDEIKQIDIKNKNHKIEKLLYVLLVLFLVK